MESSSTNFHVDSPVSLIRRCVDGKVAIQVDGRQELEYDHVVVATHTDQAL